MIYTSHTTTETIFSEIQWEMDKHLKANVDAFLKSNVWGKMGIYVIQNSLSAIGKEIME